MDSNHHEHHRFSTTVHPPVIIIPNTQSLYTYYHTSAYPLLLTLNDTTQGSGGPGREATLIIEIINRFHSGENISDILEKRTSR